MTQKVNYYDLMVDLGSFCSLSWLKMMIFSKTSPVNDPGESLVNPVKSWKSSISVEIMSIVCIMFVLDGF